MNTNIREYNIMASMSLSKYNNEDIIAYLSELYIIIKLGKEC